MNYSFKVGDRLVAPYGKEWIFVEISSLRVSFIGVSEFHSAILSPDDVQLLLSVGYSINSTVQITSEVDSLFI